MTLRAALHLALCFLLLSALAGCAGLPFRDDAEQDAQTAPKRPPQFRLTVDAPSRLQALLLQHLDLARLQYAAEADALTRTEIDRLIGAAAAQAESLLNTEGYFNPVIKVQRVEDGAVPPLLRMSVQPGPRATIQRLTHAFPKYAWINPEPLGVWQYRQSIAVIQQIMNQRMFPLTLQGLEGAMRLLSK